MDVALSMYQSLRSEHLLRTSPPCPYHLHSSGVGVKTSAKLRLEVEESFKLGTCFLKRTMSTRLASYLCYTISTMFLGLQIKSYAPLPVDDLVKRDPHMCCPLCAISDNVRLIL